MIVFFIGLVIGAWLGVAVMACCARSGDAARCEGCEDRFIQMDVIDVGGKTVTTWMKRRDVEGWRQFPKPEDDVVIHVDPATGNCRHKQAEDI